MLKKLAINRQYLKNRDLFSKTRNHPLKIMTFFQFIAAQWKKSPSQHEGQIKEPDLSFLSLIFF